MTAVATPSESYLALIREFPLRPIRSEEELDAAIAMTRKLIDREVSQGMDEQEQDYLDILGDLIHAYEAKTNPLPEMTPVEALRHFLEANEMTQSQLAEETGLAMTTISEILHGRRNISAKARKALAERFKVDPSVFA